MTQIETMLKEARRHPAYWAQRAMRFFVRDLLARMASQRLTRAELAARIGASPAYVSKALRGDVNFTLETMAKLALATGARLRVELEDMPGFLDDVHPRFRATPVTPAPTVAHRQHCSPFRLQGSAQPSAAWRVSGAVAPSAGARVAS
jgi:transcriptional regulator with XRE-family HTH domain